MTTGQLIQKARKEAGLTQEELGAKLGVSGSMMAQYETGRRTPKNETLQRIADALDISVSSLLGRADDILSPALQRAFMDALLKRVEGEFMQADPADIEEVYGTEDPYKDVFEGKETLTLKMVEDMADELGVPLEYLIAGENNPADRYPLCDEELEACIDLAESKLIETVHRICGMYTHGIYFSKAAWDSAKIDLIREYIEDSQAVLQKMMASMVKPTDTDGK